MWLSRIRLFRFSFLVKLGLLSGAILSLSGCGGMFSNQARCPFNDKGGCQSVSDVNKMVSEGKFTEGGRFVQQAGQHTTSPDSAASTTSMPWEQQTAVSTTNPGGWHALTPYSGQPLRTQEVDGRMWVAPWQDQAGSFHGASYITFVVRAPQWSMTPAKAIKTMGSSD